jgi:hypothetical protein
MGSFNRGLSDKILEMEIGMPFEDRLDGVFNYNHWKERIMLVLMEKNIWEFVDTHINPSTDATYFHP